MSEILKLKDLKVKVIPFFFHLFIAIYNVIRYIKGLIIVFTKVNRNYSASFSIPQRGYLFQPRFAEGYPGLLKTTSLPVPARQTGIFPRRGYITEES